MADYTLLRSNRLARFRGPLQIISLHLFDDHLAVLRLTSFTLEVKRYFFKDMMGLVAVRSRFFAVVPALWGLTAVAGAFISRWVAAAGLLGLVFEWWWGARAAFSIRTAHSVDTLSPMSRLKRIRRVITTVAAKVLESQGGWPDSRPAHADFDPVVFHGTETARKPAQAAASAKSGFTGVYATLWLMVIPNFVMTATGFVYPSIFIGAPAVFGLSLIGMIYVLLQLNRMPSATRWTKAAGWYGGLSAVASMGMMMLFYYKAAFNKSLDSGTPWVTELDLLIHMSMDPTYSTFMHPMAGNLVMAGLLLGVAVSKAIPSPDEPGVGRA